MWGWKLWAARCLEVDVFLTSSQICSAVDIPTQLPTQGQWWSNLAMQRLHTAQCLDLMGFRICKVIKAVECCLAIANILCKDHQFPARVKSLPSRYCRICSDPGCPSLPAPQLSGGRKQETKAGLKKKKKKTTKDVAEKWMKHLEMNLAKVYLAPQQKIYWQCTYWGWDFQLNDHTGGSADSLWTGTKAPLGFTVSFTHQFVLGF